MKHLFTFLIALIAVSWSSAQEYNDYIGAGHSAGITVTSSSDVVGSEAIKTIDGTGMDSDLFAAGRFLSQAANGGNLDLITEVRDVGFEQWIDDQQALSATYLKPEVENVWAIFLDTVEQRGYEDPDDQFGPAWTEWSSAWFQVSVAAEDQLRQRVAFALSQILVTSMNSDLGGEAVAVADYYDIFVEHAFGNFRDILSEVSLHPAMAYYLSHLNNPKAIPEENVHPDENYAREIMQLFSIGLYELNVDGTHQLDANGNSIPTYDNNDIKEMAKIFTGFGPGATNGNVWWTDNEPYFGLGTFGIDWTVPLAMYQDYHETEEKVILKNDTIPANQPGMDDFNQTIDILFNHQNVAPFISYRLIQRLVKSNPTPEYVARVATIFNDNGNGVKGDLGAVVKTILLDTEAREGDYMFEQHSSKLREPLHRRLQMTRGLETESTIEGRYWNNHDWNNSLKQLAMNSPTVFNFYPPDHQPVGDISEQGMVSPEFKIHDTASGVNYFNAVNSWTQNNEWGGLLDGRRGFYNPDLVNDDGTTGGYDRYQMSRTTIDYEVYKPYATDIEKLINELDKVLTYGQLSDEVRQSLRDNIPNITWTGYDWEKERIKTAIYLIVVSPDYAVIR